MDSVKIPQKAQSKITGPSSGPVACWSCQGPVSLGDLFCGTCKAVQAPGQIDHYARLGLDVTYDVDEGALERGYFEKQRLLHPDRFATRSAKERSLSMQQATSLNEAFETLKDPLKRADYLCHLKGIAVLTEGCDLVTDTELLMETMEMREALSEAETLDDVKVCLTRASKDIKDCVQALSDAFADDQIEKAAHLTTRLKYLNKLSEEARSYRSKMKRVL